MKEPYTINIIPQYGPEAGGTHIFIFGSLFGDAGTSTLSVTFNRQPFTVVDRYGNIIIIIINIIIIIHT